MSVNVGIVGAGVIGAMAAWRLAEQGIEVHAYEQLQVGHDRGASTGQSRRFSVQSQGDERITPLVQAAGSLWRELEASTRSQVLIETGGVIVGASDSPSVASAIASAERYGSPYEVLSVSEAKRWYPPLRVGSEQVVVADPVAGVLRPETAVISAVRRAAVLGAQVHEWTTVLDIVPTESKVVLHTSDGVHEHDHVILATGSWFGEFAPGLAGVVSPRRLLQTWFLAENPARFGPRTFPVFEFADPIAAFGIPSLDGATVKVGFNFGDHPLVPDLKSIDRSVPPEFIRQASESVVRLVDGLYPTPVTTAVNVEGYTRDGLPVVGALPDHPRLHVAAGFSGSGFKYAPAVGELLARQIAGRPVPWEVGFLSAGREAPQWEERTV